MTLIYNLMLVPSCYNYEISTVAKAKLSLLKAGKRAVMKHTHIATGPLVCHKPVCKSSGLQAI